MKIVHVIRNRWWIFALLVIIIAGVVYWHSQNNTEEDGNSILVTRGTLTETLSLAGELAAEEQVQLHFQTGGRLSWVGVKEGDYLKQYDGIASLDVRQLQKTLQKYLNTYSKERRDFEQSIDDNDELAIALSKEIRERAKRVLENAQFDLDNSVLDVELQAIAKEYSFLYTPIAGIVTRIDTPQAGMNVLATNIFEVTNPDTLYMSVSADQTEVIDLYEGQKGIITFDAYPQQTIEGTITSIGFTPKSGEIGAVYEVKMAFTAPEKTQYRLGMTGDVDFILNEISNAIYLPDQYIFEEGTHKYVWKRTSKGKEKVMVKTGNEYDGNVQILDGLYEGDIVIEQE